jgi:hypothetical protein
MNSTPQSQSPNLDQEFLEWSWYYSLTFAQQEYVCKHMKFPPTSTLCTLTKQEISAAYARRDEMHNASDWPLHSLRNI